jgi:tRNA(His) guanylyltransferase
MVYNKDMIGTRMKDNYESRTQTFLPRRTYTLIRIDGKAWHTYTKNLKRPFDGDLATDIDVSVIKLMREIQGACFAYCQSDEISILSTDFAQHTTDAWFNGNVQKITSVSASLMTSAFNYERFMRYLGEPNFKMASFDSRVFTIPERTEVGNYFTWRNKDCIRNSVSMFAHSMFSPKELHGRNTPTMIEMIKFKSGIVWSECPHRQIYGRIIRREQTGSCVEKRPTWTSFPAWDFVHEPKELLSLIPTYPE